MDLTTVKRMDEMGINPLIKEEDNLN